MASCHADRWYICKKLMQLIGMSIDMCMPKNLLVWGNTWCEVCVLAQRQLTSGQKTFCPEGTCQAQQPNDAVK